VAYGASMNRFKRACHQRLDDRGIMPHARSIVLHLVFFFEVTASCSLWNNAPPERNLVFIIFLSNCTIIHPQFYILNKVGPKPPAVFRMMFKFPSGTTKPLGSGSGKL
jgi:hypothetical protein